MASAVSGPTDFRSIHGLHLLYAIAEHSCQVLAMGQAAGARGLQMGGPGGPDEGLGDSRWGAEV